LGDARNTPDTVGDPGYGMKIRTATREDLEPIRAIYNHYVQTSTCTYQTEPETAEARLAWFLAHGPEHPITVCEADGAIVGWGSLSRYNPREGYRATAESSIYIREAMHRRGLGKAMLLDLLGRAVALGHHTVIAGVSADQEASLALHRALGFVDVGHLREVGHKFGRWLDVVYLQKMLR
jgi:phosphinothricin acetyltransferase